MSFVWLVALWHKLLPEGAYLPLFPHGCAFSMKSKNGEHMLDLIQGMALGCMLLLAMIVLRDFGRLAVARVFLLLLMAGSCMLLNGYLPPRWQWITADLMTTVPALFWLLCQLAFAHKPRFKSVWTFVAVYSFLAPALARPLGGSWPVSEPLHLLGWQLPSYCEYLLTLHGLWVVAANWRDDLVESRRQMRGIVIGGVGIAVLVIIVSMNTGQGARLPLALVVLLSCLITGYFLLHGKTGVLLGASPVVHGELVDTETVEPVLDKDVQRLNSLMAGGFYRTEYLTLGILAEALHLPEYKTRQLINQTLGYRNFNDYINQLRISEACQRLLAEPQTPVLNISLDVGYRTLSSFNRAFKDIQGCSPTAYREAHPDQETA